MDIKDIALLDWSTQKIDASLIHVFQVLFFLVFIFLSIKEQWKSKQNTDWLIDIYIYFLFDAVYYSINNKFLHKRVSDNFIIVCSLNLSWSNLESVLCCCRCYLITEPFITVILEEPSSECNLLKCHMAIGQLSEMLCEYCFWFTATLVWDQFRL